MNPSAWFTFGAMCFAFGVFVGLYGAALIVESRKHWG